MPNFVSDHSFTYVPSDQLKAAGYSGDIGYCSHDPGKDWKPDQIKERLGVGLQCGIVWETVNNRASTSGAAGGTEDGPVFVQMAQALGATGGVLWLCLEDPSPAPVQLWDNVDAYARAAVPFLRAAGFGVGGYGSDHYLSHAKQLGLIDKKWAVETWPKGDWGPELIQLANSHPLNTFGGAVDCNIATDDWGHTAFFGEEARKAGPPPMQVLSHDEGPMAIAVYPKDPTRTDGVELGADGRLFHWARNNMAADIIHPEEWPVSGPNSGLHRILWCQWKPDSSGMWCAVVDVTGQGWISLMSGGNGSFSPFTQLTGTRLKV